MALYEFIKTQASFYSIRSLCDYLSVSYSSYYAWLRGLSHLPTKDTLVEAEAVKRVFMMHKRRYGARRIQVELAEQGVHISRHKIRSLMRMQGLVAIQPKSFVPKTTQSRPDTDRSPNVLLDRPNPTKPNEVFVGDITYLPVKDIRWGYLATWQDLCTREIVGWELMDTMPSELIIKALQKAIGRRKLPAGLIIHSDGGGQYASKEFRKLLRKHRFEQSMTRKENHYDNAYAESLFSRFKAELLEKGMFDNLEDAYTETFEYIEIYYNRQRRHSGIGYQIPAKYAETLQ